MTIRRKDMPREVALFSFSVSERKIMNHFVVLFDSYLSLALLLSVDKKFLDCIHFPRPRSGRVRAKRLTPVAFISLDQLVRARQHVGRNRHADLLGGLEIDEELELRRLLHWQIGGLGSLQDLVHKVSGAPP